jgi:hypothetical protein
VEWSDRLDASARPLILTELRAVQSSTLFDMRPALQTELEMARTSIKKGDGFIDPMGKNNIPILPAERAEVIAEVERTFAAIEAAWDSPDFVQKFPQMRTGLRNVKSGLFIAGYDNVRTNMDRTQRQLRDAIDALEKP